MGDRRDLSLHLTIGRVRSGRNRKALLEKLNSEISISSEMEVTEIQFTASELTTKGPIYSPIEVIPLQRPSGI